MDLNLKRKLFAEEIRSICGIQSARIVEAFAKVEREKFLGPGPWLVKPPTLGVPYQKTKDANPEHLYLDVLVALDPEKGLNNGLPSWHGRILQAIDPQPGERVAHIGCGVGYYTAILKEIVGSEGEIIAVEIEKALADRAKENLSSYLGVGVHFANGSFFDPGKVDVFYVNAGVTHLQKLWIENLRMGGRLVAPLTPNGEVGQLLRITRLANGYKAEFVGGVFVYDCAGSRDPDEELSLKDAVKKFGWQFSGQLRFDLKNCDESCWLKTKEYWLSTEPIMKQN